MSLEETKAQLLAVGNVRKDLLSKIAELSFQEVRTEEYLAEALSQLHNSGEIDLVELVKDGSDGFSGHRFFKILYVFEQALPSLEVDIESVLSCLVCLKKKAGRDLFLGRFYSAFQNYCRMDEKRPDVGIQFILSQDDLNDYVSFLSSSLLAFQPDNFVSAIQIIERLIIHEDRSVRNEAYLALGRLDVDDAQVGKVWGLICARAKSEKDNTCLASLLLAMLHHGARFPSYWQEVEKLLEEYLDVVSPEVQYEISDIVAFRRVDLSGNILQFLLKKLADVSPKDNRVVQNIDYALVELCTQSLPHLAVDLLESSLINGVSVKSLNYFSNELVDKHRELFEQLVTKWFLSGKGSLCNAVFELLHDDLEEDVTFKVDMSVLDDDEKQLYVCRKAVGWLFTKPISAASFILSIYDSASAIIKKEVEQLLYDPLLMSYPGKVRDFFQESITQGVYAEVCERLLSRFSEYHEKLEKIRGLKELRAPAEDLNTYWKDFGRRMRQAQDEGPKPFFKEICTVQNLLYGNTSVYYQYDGSGTPVRQEMQMKSFSHSAEMPVLNILDAERLDYQLRVYRHEIIKDETDS
ncbi:MAG: hypothetical protein CMI12_07425 [Oceanospirillum sp.]|nr:hypothetical protein [Oceanospirillum sp.]